MEIKKINKLLLGIFVLHILIVALVTIFPDMFQIGIILNLSLGEIILFVPTLIYLLLWMKGLNSRRESDSYPEFRTDAQREDDAGNRSETLRQRLHFNNVKPSTFLYVLLFTWLSMPLTTLINAISMLFVDNTVASLSELMSEIPFPIMLFLMAVTPAFCEEIVFRGVVYGGYRRGGNKFWAVILSGFMFGIMHMNLNQALYAFAIGILLALLFEATDSIITTMLFHFIYNSQSCCLMYLAEAVMPGYLAEASNMAATPEELYMMISVYLVLAAIFTPLAICILYKIAKNENRVVQLKETLPGRQEGKFKIATVSYILASVIAVGYIIFDMIAVKLF
ncbi:MAG: CPBP family intramembrane metalloprotease [Lachnospiraceae bacterium]|nr:CPBP family intramembrane metalloprotease [Lachnospiraceae bacterium]